MRPREEGNTSPSPSGMEKMEGDKNRREEELQLWRDGESPGVQISRSQRINSSEAVCVCVY